MTLEPGILESVKRLVSSYIRGELTAGEVREQVRADAAMAGLTSDCIGVSTFPHELLEQAGVDPFVSEMEFDPPLAITRDGMIRNLDLAQAGELPPVSLSDWVADWFSWQIAARPDDDVILELAGELMLGEESVEEILGDPFRLELVRWHLANTPAAMGGTTAFGLQVAAVRPKLEDLIGGLRGDDLNKDGLTSALEGMFRDHLDAMPGLADDLAEAIRLLGLAEPTEESIRLFLEQIARTADPLSAVSTGAD